MRKLVLFILLVGFAACGRPRKSGDRPSSQEPFQVYRGAIERSDSAAAKAGRQSRALDSLSTEGR